MTQNAYRHRRGALACIILWAVVLLYIWNHRSFISSAAGLF